MKRTTDLIRRAFADPASNALILAAALPLALLHASKGIVDLAELDIPVIAGTMGERSLWTFLLGAVAFHAGKEGRDQGLAAGWTAAAAAAYALLGYAASGWAEAMAHLAAAAAAALGYASGRAYAAAMRSRSLLTFAPAILAAGIAGGLAGAPAWNLAARNEAETAKISIAANRLLAEYRAISEGGLGSRAHWEAVNRFSVAVLESPFNGDAFVMNRYMDYASYERRRQAIEACKRDSPGDKSCLGKAEDIGGEAYQRPAGGTRFLATALKIASGRV